MVAAHVPLAGYSEAHIARGLRDLDWVSDRALAHEAVVEHFMRARAVVPMKLFTIFTSDTRALAHVQRRRIDRIVARVGGCAEWGVRVTLDRMPATARPSRARSGRAFLETRRRERTADRVLLGGGARDASRAFQRLRRRARAARRRPAMRGAPGAARLLLDAAFLVPAREGAAFRTAVAALAREMAPRGYGVTLTGPWPPYNFIGRA